VPVNLPSVLVPQIKIYVSTSDISLLSQSLTILALLLELSPSTTYPEVERDVLAYMYAIAHSPLVSGAALDSVLSFFHWLVQADGQISTHIVPNLVKSVEKAPKSESSSANVAKCIAQIVRSQQGVAAGTIVEFARHIKVCSCIVGFHAADDIDSAKKNSKATPPHIVLSLLILGELGRFM
jgi:cullin-associated NEDD8-dissociated protein 1